MTSANSNKGSVIKVGGFLFTILITVAFLYFAFRNVNMEKALEIISRSSVFVIILYLIVFMLSHYVRALRWGLMLKSVKENISKNHLFGSVIVSYGVSCVIPRLGEIYRALFLGKWENISRTTVLGTIVVERIIDITFFAFASLVSSMLFPGDLFKEVTWLRTSLVIGFGLIFFAIISLLLLTKYQARFAALFVNIFEKINHKLAAKIKELFDLLIDGFACIKSFTHVLLILFYSLLIMILYALNTYVGFFMLDMHNAPNITFITAWIVMTIGSFGVLIPTPGGTGSYHAITFFVLTQLFMFSSEVSAAYAILTHFISYVSFLIPTFLIIHFFNKQRIKQGLPKETFFTVLKNN